MARDTRGGGGSPSTPVKQEHFNRIIRQHLAMVRAIWNKHPEWDLFRTFLYIDCNPGPGFVADKADDTIGYPGSPCLALRAALEGRIQIRMLLFELDEEHCRTLRENLVNELQDYVLTVGPHPHDCLGCFGCDRLLAEEHLNSFVTIVPGDHNVTIPQYIADHQLESIKRGFLGLVYTDGYGKKDLALEPLQTLFAVPCFKRLDGLVHAPSIAYKRTRGAGQRAARDGKVTRMTDHIGSYLLDDLALLGKRQVWLREPVGVQQWTMALVTNYVAYRASKTMGFLNLETPAGALLAQRLNYWDTEDRRAN